MCKPAKNTQKIKKYHANLCIFGLVVIMIVVFFLFLFGFPFFLKWVYGKFANGMIWNKIPPIAETGQEDNALSVLPDFLGGLCGIIIGFLFDLLFIEKIRKISRYKFLSSSVNREFSVILKTIANECSTEFKLFLDSVKDAAKMGAHLPDGITIDNNGTIKCVEHAEESQKACFKQIQSICGRWFSEEQELQRWDLDDIVTNVENDALFYRLPFMIGLKGKMTESLHTINGCILRFNNSRDVNIMTGELVYLLINIYKFFAYTGYDIKL